MAELKTKPTDADVGVFLQSIEDEQRRADCLALHTLMSEALNLPAVMWGEQIVGYGRYDYKYPTGNSGSWFLAGFAPRKQNLTLYIMAGFEQYDALMSKLGKYKTGKSCLYVKKLADVDADVLRELVVRSVEHMRQTYKSN